MRTRALPSAALALALVVLGASPARAQATEADVSAARALFEQGVAAYDEGRLEEAEDRFRRSLALHGSTSVQFNLAVVLAARGLLVEARERFLQVRAAGDAPAGMVEAATAQAEALAPRVAQLEVRPPEGAEVSVRLDDRAIDAALLGVPFPVDPGEHELVGESADGRRTTVTVRLAEGERRTVDLTLPPPVPSPADVAAAALDPSPPTEPTSSSGEDLTWVAVVVGVAVAALAAVGIGVGLAVDEARFYRGNVGDGRVTVEP